MNSRSRNEFQRFFEQETYVALKNSLYNYLLRKKAVERNLQGETPGAVLESGSGISPMITGNRTVVYTDLSLPALKILRRRFPEAMYVVADSTHLPFKSDVFTHAVSSEVLEHIPDDRTAVRETRRVLKDGGRFIITFPHRKMFYSFDDRFVGHCRRYELIEMRDMLEDAGFHILGVEKVLGPLEKITMMLAAYFYAVLPRKRAPEARGYPPVLLRLAVRLFRWVNMAYMLPVWLDSRFTPRALATVMLVKARKTGEP